MSEEAAIRLESVSAIIPTYNSEKYIERTLLSLLQQTMGFSEIIIIDNYSQDNTLSIVMKYSERYGELIKIVSLKKNYGVSYARNMGINLAKSDWILFMDHDDIAGKTLLEDELNRLEGLEKETGAKWILAYSSYQQISDKDEEIGGVLSSQQVGPDEILGYQFVRNSVITTSGVLAKKYEILETGGFNEKLLYSQDWDLWLRLAQMGGFAYVDKPLVRVRRHLDNTSSNVNNFINDELTILKKYNQEFIRDAVYKRCLPVEKNKLDFISILYRLGYWEEGLNILREIIKENNNLHSALFFLGLYYLKKQEWKDAESAFRRVIELDSSHGAALNNWGVALGYLGKSEEAITLFKQATFLYPNYNDAMYNLEEVLGKGQNTHLKMKITWRELRTVLLSYSSNI